MAWTRLSVLALTLAAPLFARADEPLKIEPGDHVVIVGGTLAERTQHDGWLETLLQSRFPGKDIVVRNLAFPGDEVNVRPRSDGFGSPDAHLTKQKADVILAFFGFNESFAGKDGLPRFEKALDDYLKHLKQQKYNGKSAPRVVLFSPVAAEDLHSQDLPDGRATNANIALYTQAMAEVAKRNDVKFVDLFAPSQRLIQQSDKPLTTNGIYWTEAGDEKLAEVIDAALFGPRSEPIDTSKLQPLRHAVQDKSFYQFHRYRTTDGYSTYGGRADLAFTNGQTNREVMDRELQILDEMTANRDRKIWAATQGRDLKVDDSNTAPFLEVISNKPGEGPNGTHVFLGGEEAISKMTLGKGLKVNLFASEEMFPELINPVQMAFDTRGRLWVATWPSYPHWKPKEEMNDRLVILEDTNGDGKADVCKTFADGLHNPTGFEFYKGGVIVAMAPDILFLQDVDGDDRADTRTQILHGIDSADTHHTSNSFTLDPGGALYFQEGTFHRTNVETPYGPVRNLNAGVWRFEPRTNKLERFIPFDFANPHGHVFNAWGQDIVVDGTGANPYHGTLFSGHLDYPHKHPAPPQVYQQRTRPCSGIELLSSRHFPDDMQGDLLVCNVIGFSGILRYDIRDKGASFEGIEAEPLVFSSDVNFRPADVEVGADGAIYFTDWHNPIIGHMQHNLRDPNRDRVHGRVYRITAEDRPLLKPERIAGASIPELFERLKSPEDRVRYRARIELSARTPEQVLPLAMAWLSGLDPNDPNVEHHRMEGLWVHQSLNRVNEPLLRERLKSPVADARAAAVRVLCYWRDRVSDPLALLRAAAQDENPCVRLEAVRACSFFDSSEAADVALEVLRRPMDVYLSYTLKETMRQLEPAWKGALADGRPFAVGNPAGVDYVLQSVNSADLIKMPRTPTVILALLTRPNIPPQYRREALAALATAHKVTPLQELVANIDQLDRLDSASSEQALHDLGSMLFEDLSAPASAEHNHEHHGGAAAGQGLGTVREPLVNLAKNGRHEYTRQLALAAWMTGDGKFEPALQFASGTARSLVDWLDAVRLLPDAQLRASAYPAILPLASADTAGWPRAVAAQLANAPRGTHGRYVRISLPRQGTLTLAEVQVLDAAGKNIATTGKAAQSSESHGGKPERAIDGNTSGTYANGGQTHTRENEKEPWWELDLGSEMPISGVTVWNRSENQGQFARRLDGFTLTVLDAHRGTVFVREAIPAPAENVNIAMQGDPRSQVRRAAFEALVSSGADSQKVFTLLSHMARAGDERDAALRALGRIPADQWPRGELKPLIDSIIENVNTLSAEDRRAPAVRDSLQIAGELANRLPTDQASPLRKTLRTLGVPVVLIRPVPHLIVFDRTQIYVEAGRPFELVFENVDIMPHNVVITRPGQLAKVGVAGEAMAADPNAYAKNFVPNLPEVLFSTRLLAPGSTERLLIDAPSEPGDYPFVCTFPGHWTRMNGVIHVVPDLDAVPREALLAASAPATAAAPGATRAFVQAWKVDDLAGELNRLDLGRNRERGKQLFQSLACTQCHKFGNVGTAEVGPDLVSVRKKRDAGQAEPRDILTEMIEPSKVIDPRFQTLILALTNGETVTGVATARDAKTLRITSNPLAPQGAVVREIPASDVEEELVSKISIMPEGLLNTLDKEEILDLLDYLLSGGE